MTTQVEPLIDRLNEVKPVFSPQEAETIIHLLEYEARASRGRGEYYRNIIAKIQCTEGYQRHSGVIDAPLVEDSFLSELEKDEPKSPGYHLEEIPRGTYGEISKILEEAAELKDAMEQANKLMVLIELSDIIGAIDGYLDKYYGKSMTIDNLITMAFTTKRAFESGRRE